MKRYIVLMAVLAGGACVSASKYNATEASARAHEQRAQALEAKVADLQKAKDDLAAQLKIGADALAAAQKSQKDIQETLDAKKGELTKKVPDLIKERDGLTADLNAKEAEIAATKRQAEEAEAAKKALEEAKAAELAAVKKNYEDLNRGLKAEIAAGEIKITELSGKLTVNMVDRILFDSGEADVKPAGRKVLEKVGKVLNGVDGKDIRIEGHTDNPTIVRNPKSRYPTNWELSTARATAVARYLEDQAKVDPAHLVAAGYGEYRPVASNDTVEGKALNRRIEIVLVPRE
jgi:chemotaxis protein MotB